MPGITSMLQGFDPDLPLEQAKTLPAAWYTAPALATLEQREVFRGAWQAIGRVEQIATPGSYLTAEVAGVPVLVIRGEDQVLRAFYNVCRHRAAPLLTQPCGEAHKLRCRYHGWTYDLTGALRGTPEFDGVEQFRREDHGLLPLGAVETWGPFVWVHLDPPREPLAAFLGPFPAWWDEHPQPELLWAEQRVYDLACNWKVYVDNYLDGGYHVNTVHPDLAGVLNYQEYRTTTAGNTSLQSSPLVPGDGSAGQTRKGDRAYYWWVFPNLMVNIYGGVMDTNRVLPLGPDRCRVIFDFYFAVGTKPEFIRNSIAVADQVQAEDATICEEVQRGLSSGVFDTGRFSVKRENAGYEFHRILARRLQAAKL